MPERFAEDLSKDGQLRRSPGKENRPCPDTGQLIRDCDCFKHRNARNRKQGIRKQVAATKRTAKALGVSNPGRIGNEETTRLPIRIEWKSGKQVDWLDGFYEDCRAQADTLENKAVGDTRGFAAGAITNMGRHLLVIELEDLRQLWRER